jgi:UDP-glucose 4-epimerase
MWKKVLIDWAQSFFTRGDVVYRRILITGGAGFIGSHLAEAYLRQEAEVYIIDNLSTGSLENLKHLQDNPEFSGRLFVSIDTIFNEDKLLELIGTCDIVIHLAAAVGVKFILDNPLSSMTTNIQGAEIVLRLCNKFRKPVLVASTSEAYGKQEGAPLSEEDDVTYGSSGKARWSYAASKLMDEFLALAYHRTTKLPVVVVRLFNTVGPRQTGEYGMVVPRFIQQALRDEDITVYGDGKQTRTFTHVEEVCRCMQKLMETSDAFGTVVNIGGVEEVSIEALAKRILEKTESASTIRLIPYDDVFSADFEDMPRRVPCTKKLKSLIEYAPSMKLDDILVDVIEHHRSHAH